MTVKIKWPLGSLQRAVAKQMTYTLRYIQTRAKRDCKWSQSQPKIKDNLNMRTSPMTSLILALSLLPQISLPSSSSQQPCLKTQGIGGLLGSMTTSLDRQWVTKKIHLPATCRANAHPARISWPQRRWHQLLGSGWGGCGVEEMGETHSEQWKQEGRNCHLLPDNIWKVSLLCHQPTLQPLWATTSSRLYWHLQTSPSRIKGWRFTVDSQTQAEQNQHFMDESDALITPAEKAELKTTEPYVEGLKVLNKADQGKVLSFQE